MKILIVDDHALFVDGLKALLDRLVPGVLTLQAHDMPGALQVLSQQSDVNIVLLDLGLPGTVGIEALVALKCRYGQLPVVALSGNTDKDTVIATLNAGAMGFIPKSISAQGFMHALGQVLNDGIYLPSCVFSHNANLPPVDIAGQQQRKRLHDLGFTERQAEVFKQMIRGDSNKLIAKRLGVTESTVKAHISPILKKLNVTSRVEAIVVMAQMGLFLE